MSDSKPLLIWDRKLGKLTQEYMTDSPATYETKPHRSLTNLLQSHPAYDWFVSIYQNTKLSARKIGPFIRKHHIDMDQFEPGPYRSYAAFFEESSRRASVIFRRIQTSLALLQRRATSGGQNYNPIRNSQLKVDL
jgi:phosphatidylserine decarboxylase